MEEHKVNCKEVMHHICDSLGEELDSPKCIAIKAHLQNCSNCTHYYKTVDNTIQFYKMYNAKLPEESHNKLMDSLGLSDCE
jgi:predicted anti-sigma-YlaC factor YlaD